MTGKQSLRTTEQKITALNAFETGKQLQHLDIMASQQLYLSVNKYYLLTNIHTNKSWSYKKSPPPLFYSRLSSPDLKNQGETWVLFFKTSTLKVRRGENTCVCIHTYTPNFSSHEIMRNMSCKAGKLPLIILKKIKEVL